MQAGEVPTDSPLTGRGVRNVLRVVGLVEAISGLVVLSVLVMVVWFIGGLGFLIDARTFHRTQFIPTRWFWPAAAAWATVAFFAGRSLAFWAESVQVAYQNGEAHTPLMIARRRLRLPTLLRPIVAAWWLVLTTGALWVAHGLAESLRPRHGFFAPPLGESVPPLVVLFGASVATNVCFMTAAAAATGSDRLLRIIGVLRLPIDIAVTIVLARISLPSPDLN